MPSNGRSSTLHMRGQIRLHLGVAHEQAVAERLVEYGWTVQPWGQGLIIPEIRAVIGEKRPAVLWRWVPDLVAVRGRQAVLVDPKSSWRENTGNFSIELNAYLAHQIMRHLLLPIAYVFADFTANTVEDLRPISASLDAATFVQGGSGTPYMLVRKADQRPFDALFGPRKD